MNALDINPDDVVEELRGELRGSHLANLVEAEDVSGLVGAAVAYVEALHNVRSAAHGNGMAWYGPIPPVVLDTLRAEWKANAEDRDVVSELAEGVQRVYDAQQDALTTDMFAALRAWEDEALDPEDSLDAIARYPDEVARIRRVQMDMRAHPVYVIAASLGEDMRRRLIQALNVGDVFNPDLAEEFYLDEICDCGEVGECRRCVVKAGLEDLAHEARIARMQRTAGTTVATHAGPVAQRLQAAAAAARMEGPA